MFQYILIYSNYALLICIQFEGCLSHHSSALLLTSYIRQLWIVSEVWPIFLNKLVYFPFPSHVLITNFLSFFFSNIITFCLKAHVCHLAFIVRLLIFIPHCIAMVILCSSSFIKINHASLGNAEYDFFNSKLHFITLRFVNCQQTPNISNTRSTNLLTFDWRQT